MLLCIITEVILSSVRSSRAVINISTRVNCLYVIITTRKDVGAKCLCEVQLYIQLPVAESLALMVNIRPNSGLGLICSGRLSRQFIEQPLLSNVTPVCGGF